MTYTGTLVMQLQTLVDVCLQRNSSAGRGIAVRLDVNELARPQFVSDASPNRGSRVTENSASIAQNLP